MLIQQIYAYARGLNQGDEDLAGRKSISVCWTLFQWDLKYFLVFVRGQRKQFTNKETMIGNENDIPIGYLVTMGILRIRNLRMYPKNYGTTY